MKKVLSIILVILWMIVIFSFSNQIAEVSSKQSGFLTNIIISIFGSTNEPFIHHLVRKLAHFTEYLILGVLVLNMLRYYKPKDIIILAILICFLYACLDEIHQIFIQGRVGTIKDALIDLIGSLTGIFIYKAVKKV